MPKSRQEFVPLVTELIDRAHVEPLHLKNNICALAHCHVLNLAVSKLPSSFISSFSHVPMDTLFYQFVDALRSKCNLRRLAKKVIRWYNENAMERREFEYSFTECFSTISCSSLMFWKKALRVRKLKLFFIMQICAFVCEMVCPCSVILTSQMIR
jgi:hypothetical protein